MQRHESSASLKRAFKQGLSRIPLVAKWKYKWNDQLRSNLFKLPYELRTKIWALVLEGYTVQITLLEDKLSGMLMRWWGNNWKPAGQRMHLLELLLTCRRIYTETIERLYTGNNFHIIGAHPIRLFPEIVPRINLDLIRTVRTTEIWRGGPQALEDALEILSSLKGLRRLQIECSGTFPDNTHWSRTLDGAQILMNEAAIRRALHRFTQVEYLKLIVYEWTAEQWRLDNPVPQNCVVERRHIEKVTQKRKRVWFRRAYEKPGGVLEPDPCLASIHFL